MMKSNGREEGIQHSLTVIGSSSSQSDELTVWNLEQLKGILVVLVEELIVELISDDYRVSIDMIFSFLERCIALKFYIGALIRL